MKKSVPTVQTVSPKIRVHVMETASRKRLLFWTGKIPKKQKKRLTAEKQAIFFTRLAALLQAGIPLLSALDILSPRDKQDPLQAIFPVLREEVVSGNGLAAGLQKFPFHFDPVTCYLVEAGEQSGTLGVLTGKISFHKQKMAALHRKLVQACFYPTLTLVLAGAITLFMLSVVTPKFAALFHEMRLPLPAVTRCVLNLGAFMKKAALPLLLLACLTGGFLRRQHRGIPDSLLRIPIAGGLLQKIILARIASTLAVLFEAGIPLPAALGMTARLAGNSRYAEATHKLAQALSQGSQLHEALQQSSCFPALMQEMIRAGEVTGTLGTLLEKVASLYEREVDHGVQLLGQLLEPLIMSILGVLIGGLVIAMYLPIFSLGNAF